MVSDEVRELSRRTAVGAASLAAQKRPFDMGTLIGLYMKECDDEGMLPCDALVVLNQSLIGLAVFAAGDDALSTFEELAQKMAVRS